MTRPGKTLSQAGSEPRIFRSRGRLLNHYAYEVVLLATRSMSQIRICSDNYSQATLRQYLRIKHLSHPVMAYWHQANLSQHWPCNTRRLADSPRAVLEMHSHVAGTLSNQPTNKLATGVRRYPEGAGLRVHTDWLMCTCVVSSRWKRCPCNARRLARGLVTWCGRGGAARAHWLMCPCWDNSWVMGEVKGRVHSQSSENKP